MRIYLTLRISNACSKRPFSVIVRIKRNEDLAIGKQRSKSLSLLYIEKELLDNSINYGKLIDELAEFKVN